MSAALSSAGLLFQGSRRSRQGRGLSGSSGPDVREHGANGRRQEAAAWGPAPCQASFSSCPVCHPPSCAEAPAPLPRAAPARAPRWLPDSRLHSLSPDAQPPAWVTPARPCHRGRELILGRRSRSVAAHPRQGEVRGQAPRGLWRGRRALPRQADSNLPAGSRSFPTSDELALTTGQGKARTAKDSSSASLILLAPFLHPSKKCLFNT